MNNTHNHINLHIIKSNCISKNVNVTFGNTAKYSTIQSAWIVSGPLTSNLKKNEILINRNLKLAEVAAEIGALRDIIKPLILNGIAERIAYLQALANIEITFKKAGAFEKGIEFLNPINRTTFVAQS